MTTGTTPSQTVGPFFHFALLRDGGDRLVPADDPESILIGGIVVDGAGAPVCDAMLELWQADPNGRFAHPLDQRAEPPLRPGFAGFGRVGTDERGAFAFTTVKPGQVPARDGALQAPHVDVSIFARGLLRRLVTRIYFADEQQANDSDPLLGSIDDPDARSTLVADASEDGYRFDVRLQGPGETQFFEL